MNKTDHPAALPSAAVPLPAITETPGMQLLQTWVVKGRLRDQPTAEERALMGTVAKALSASLTPAKPTEIAALIEDLAWHYPRQDRPDGARKSLARDWLRDVGHLPADIIDAACTAWRRDANSFAPTPGHILTLAAPILQSRKFWAKLAADLSSVPEAMPAAKMPRKDQA
jgi:hypothetical protein